MLHDNQILSKLKNDMRGVIGEKSGVVRTNKKGYGFLENAARESYFIPPKQMKYVVHGDEVTGELVKDNNRESMVLTKLDRATLTRFTGRVQLSRNGINVIPDKNHIDTIIKAHLPVDLKRSNFNDGDWVTCDLISHPLQSLHQKYPMFECKIVNLIARGCDDDAHWLVVLANQNLPTKEPQFANKEDLVSCKHPRENLEDVPFITIDGNSTKNMDDAVHTEILDNGNFGLTVAIADPTAHIAIGSNIDLDAKSRCFTTYLPSLQIPLIARNISDDLCSLREGERRLAIVCKTEVSRQGEIIGDAKFSLATVKSYARLNYNDSSDFVEGKETVFSPDVVVAQQLRNLKELSDIRAKWREEQAVVYTESPNYRFKFDNGLKVIGAYIEERRIASRMIEEAMIIANECGGILLSSGTGEGAFSTHDGFKPEKLQETLLFLEEYGSPFTADELATLKGFAAFRRWVTEQRDLYLEGRLQKYHSYSEIGFTVKPNFSMGIAAYATWTSPIRKYSDMINHRLIKDCILGRPRDLGFVNLLYATDIQDQRRKRFNAERILSDWLYAVHLSDKAGCEIEYRARILNVNSAGIRVKLIDLGAVAHIPRAKLADANSCLFVDYLKSVVKVDDKVKLKLGDLISVKITNTDAASRLITAKQA